MQSIFLGIHQFISRYKTFFIIVLILLLVAVGFLISKLKIKEDLNAIIPKDERIDKVNSILSKSKLADRIIFNFSLKDTTKSDPDKLIEKAEKLVSGLDSCKSRINVINFKINSEAFLDVYDFIYQNIPFYLTDKDYANIKKKLSPDAIDETLKNDFQSLISPTGFATRQYIFKDPLSITPIVLKRLENFQLDKNFDLYNSCIFTKDRKHLLVFLDPKNSANNIGENTKLLASIDSVLKIVNKEMPDIKVQYYGGSAVAVANAERIKKDIVLTVTITFVFLSFFFFYFFRKIRTIFLLFFPVVLGAGMSIALFALFKGDLSAIVLGIGSVLLGMSVDYTVYAVTYFKSNGSVKHTIRDIAGPLMMGVFTTVFSFLCLHVVHSDALWQLGLFTALSIFLTALVIMIILPFFLKEKKASDPVFVQKRTFLDTFAELRFDKNKYLIAIILILTIIFSLNAHKVGFNSDIASLNYLTDDLAKAEKDLSAISSESSSAVYIITQGSTLNEALQKTEDLSPIFNKFKANNTISSMSSVSDLMISEASQKTQIEKWKSFWKDVNPTDIKSLLIEKGKNHHFKDSSFTEFYTLLNKDFKTISTDSFGVLRKAFLSNYINESDKLYSTISILKVERHKKEKLFKALEKAPNAIIFDKQYYVMQFFKIIKEDFDALVILSSVLVFVILLLYFGRLEIALITFVPVIISWKWTLGLMALFGLEFNIFNIIIPSFIFGCGVDYTIYIMSGLLDDYKYGNKTLVPYKLSVLLSALTIIGGVGVLVFAKHPALKSIALVSIFGLSSVVIIGYTILPAMFTFFIKYKGKTLTRPITITDLLFTFLAFVIFLIGAVWLTIVVPTLFIFPIKVKIKKRWFSFMVSRLSHFVIAINFRVKHVFINREKLDFSKPKVIISNHQSHLDIVLLLMLNPKIIVLTNKWVWNNPFYGLIVKYADFFPVYKGIESGYDHIKEKVKDGYSILIFPEGKRSDDGEIKRFHQGALHLADFLEIDIQPVMLHGAFECLPKNEFVFRAGQITLSFFDAIKVENVQLEKDETYRKQAKEITAMYRIEYKKLRLLQETPAFYRHELFGQYIFKGPILEWYMRIKVRQERYYEFFNSAIPMNASITDIGCGYGFLPYTLHAVSNERQILGIDYDSEKIALARNIAKDKPNLNFAVLNIATEPLPASDVYIINDVLHYLPEELQYSVLEQCMQKVSQNGQIIVRDADADLIERTKMTKFTELQSTRIFKFNKTEHELTFISGKKIEELARKNGFSYSRFDNAKLTSNITHILKRNA